MRCSPFCRYLSVEDRRVRMFTVGLVLIPEREPVDCPEAVPHHCLKQHSISLFWLTVFLLLCHSVAITAKVPAKTGNSFCSYEIL